jgi:glycosyltransferase involved in cell wall biosynthesis
LRLLFLGRHDVNKGVFDLYVIHQLLKQRNIPVDWLVLGKGPETEKLKQQWEGEQVVQFFTPDTQEEVIKLASERDVFVFPTKFEGFPVALIETMSVGCVPVVSDLPGGIREIVMQGKTGFRCSMDDNEQFADSIAHLHFNRNELEAMSKDARDAVYGSYNAEVQSPRYQELFSQVAADARSPLHHKVKGKLGSRLDQPWLPNSIVKYLRKASR